MDTQTDTAEHPSNDFSRDDFPRSGDQRLWTVLILTAIAVLALALRLVDVQASLWSDEIRTYEGAVLPFFEGVTHKVYPLYFMLAHAALYFGDTEALLRLPSVLAGVAGVLALYGLGKAVHGRVAGLLAALLLAVSPYHIAYSREARFYALLMLGGILLLWALHRALRSGGRVNWGLVAAATAIATLTHLFAVAPVAVLFLGALVWLLAARHGRRQDKTRRVVALIAALLVGLAPFLALSLAKGGLPTNLLDLPQPGQGETAAEAVPPEVSAAPQAGAGSSGSGGRLTLGEYQRFLRRFVEYQPPYALASMVVLGAVGLAWLGWRRRDVAVMAVALIFVCPLPFFAVGTTHFYASRYFSMALPAILLLVAVGIASIAHGVSGAIARRTRILPGPVTALVVFVLVATLAPSVYAGIRSEYGRRAYDPWMGDWKGAAAYMGTYLRSRDVMIFAIPEERKWEVAYPLDFYIRRSMPNADIVLNTLQFFHGVPDDAQFLDVLNQFQARNIWVVSKGERDLSGPLLARLNQVAAERRDFGIVRVWQLGVATRNLAPWGGFEGDTASGFSGGPLALTGPGEALAGDQALRLRLNERQYAQAVLPFTKDGDGQALQPGETYTLSFWTRHEGVRPQQAARAGVASLDPARPFSWVFLNLAYSGAWRRHEIELRPGVDVPEDISELGFLVGVFENSGSLWLDNVQLERKPHATLFTEGERGTAISRAVPSDATR